MNKVTLLSFVVGICFSEKNGKRNAGELGVGVWGGIRYTVYAVFMRGLCLT